MQRRLEVDRDVYEEQEERDSGTEDDETDCSPVKPEAEETECPTPEDDASSGVSCDGDCEEASTDSSKVKTDTSCTPEQTQGATAALPGPLHCADASYEEDTHWKRGPILGRGACGTVYKVADIGTGLEMAMKEVCYLVICVRRVLCLLGVILCAQSHRLFVVMFNCLSGCFTGTAIPR